MYIGTDIMNLQWVFIIQDDVRRGYILKGPCQPCENDFPTQKIKKKNRHFTPVWFYMYPWPEYSIAKDGAFCFVCYLFKQDLLGELGVMHLVNFYHYWGSAKKN
jgi:hypothetical protein